MRGDETRVEDAFCRWLEAQGWTTKRQVAYVDVVADGPHGERLFAEVKGSSTDIGVDADVLYGQLLRRMTDEHDSSTRYAAVVRDDPRSIRAISRVTASVRQRLRIDVYAVAQDGAVRQVT